MAIMTDQHYTALRDMFNDMMRGKMDVTIGQEVGKLPRKMKKALHSKRMTKWKRKVASYINCAGSGTTLLAAGNMLRRAYCFEIKKDFYKAATEKVLRRF